MAEKKAPKYEEFTQCIDFTEFAGNLTDWLSGWVDDVAVPIAKQARELYEDKAIVMLLDEWASCRRDYERTRHNALYEIVTNVEYAECAESTLEILHWTDERKFQCSQLLYKLLVDED